MNLTLVAGVLVGVVCKEDVDLDAVSLHIMPCYLNLWLSSENGLFCHFGELTGSFFERQALKKFETTLGNK